MSDIVAIAKLLRYYSLTATTQAGSGHPSSCLSSADLMAGLLVGGNFHYDIADPKNENNDRLIFSKGHAAPLFYAFWTVAKGIEAKELLTLRQFGSRLEGHPTKLLPYTEVPTGSLGQGLSVGFGMALNAKYIEKSAYRTFVLMGDSEIVEGSVWEAMAEASFYKLNNLIGIIDMNRLGQRGQTMLGHDAETLASRVSAFGWQPIVIDGHSYSDIGAAYAQARASTEKPVMIIAKTIKGKGVSLLEDQEGWHGKALSREQLVVALEELGAVNGELRVELPLGTVKGGEQRAKSKEQKEGSEGREGAMVGYVLADFQGMVATREAYGSALLRVAEQCDAVLALDAEVSNSTHADALKKKYPERFFEMFIAEQHMVSAAVGLAERGKIPFISTFAAFFSRAFDQIRMAGLANANVKFVGSHAGVSIGEDGSSQMGLEDIALFRSVWGSTVLYPSDAVSAAKLVAAAAEYQGLVYLRMTRQAVPVIYKTDEQFAIGGSKVLRMSENDQFTIVAAGITLHQALAAYEELKSQNILVRVIDLYSIKPIDRATLEKAARETKGLIVVEDHYLAGGIGEAVRSVLSQGWVHSMAVQLMPHSGTSEELLNYEGISSRAIVEKVKSLI